MPLFSSPPSYLGVDLGTSSLKVVELKNERGKPRLVTYGFTNETDLLIRSDSQGDVEKTAILLRQVCDKARVTTSKAITALPTFSVFSSTINLPAMSKKDLEGAVKWEARKVIPLPLDDMILDWKIIDEFQEESALKLAGPAEAKKNIKVFLTGAPKRLVEKYTDIFKIAGLNLLSLEIEAFALSRSLVGASQATVMLVNMGAVTTNISVIVKGMPYLNRSIDVGGSTVTRAISNSLNISMERAEQFKHDIGIISVRQGGPEEILKTIEATIAPVVNEIKYTLNLYHNQRLREIELEKKAGEQAPEVVEKVILSGGMALLPYLPEYLSKILDTRVYIGDPWSRVIYPEELKPVLDEIGPKFAAAVGLAMREIE
ncbi:MAG: type IV pilus assembly protein PilM [Candidatus Doudnabacteria bacterium]|nr:type IV pilus assembly protein PilM [Candidatus Doudnabacteria bacterium]